MMPSFAFQSDWGFLTHRQNWYDFTFVRMFFENDVMMGQVEVSVCVLGLHVTATWDTGSTPERRNLERQVADLQKLKKEACDG